MADNAALLKIIGVFQEMHTQLNEGQGSNYNPLEILLVGTTAALQILCGGTPYPIRLPAIYGTGNLNKGAIARSSTGQIAATPFIPGGANFTTQTGVAADGSTTDITFPSPFPNSCLGVLCTVSNYSGTDNAVLVPNVVGDPTTDGFTVMVGGGQSGSTCTLTFFPVGT